MGPQGGGAGGPDPPPPGIRKLYLKKGNFGIFGGLDPPRLRQYFTILVGPPLVKMSGSATGTIYLSQLRDVTKALPGKLPVQIKFRLFPIDCDVRDVLF